MNTRAKEELVDELMHGKRIGNVELASILDELCNGEHYFDFLHSVTTALLAGETLFLRLYVEGRVKEYVEKDEAMVERRAQANTVEA